LPVKAGDYVKMAICWRKWADLHSGSRLRAFIDEPEMGGLEPGLPRENYLGRTGEPDLGGTDGNHTGLYFLL